MDVDLLIHHISKHVKLSASEMEYVLSCFEKVYLNRKQFILHAGEGYEFHLLVIGMALVGLAGGSGSWSLDKSISS